MEKTGKRKIVGIVILVLCIAILAVTFLALRSWFHSDGMHFIGRYGQVHMSHSCGGVDQDGNEVEAQTVNIDGVVAMTESRELGEFKDGKIDIDDLLEKNGLFKCTNGGARKMGDGLYVVTGMFIESPAWREEHQEERGEEESGGGYATIWMKDNQVVVKFNLDDVHSDRYYILYSDEEMLNVPEIKEKLSSV